MKEFSEKSRSGIHGFHNHTGGGSHTALSLLFLFFLSAFIMLRQLVTPHYFSCFVDDAYMYTSWAWQFTEALKEGIAYPRWTPLNFWGYGSPTFILYPPVAFYMVALFKVISNSIVVAMNWVKFISLFISATGVFFLVREIYTERIALLAGAFYILFPFFIFDVYISGAFTSSISLMWFPLILLFIFKYIKSGKYAHLLYAGACYGGLIMTHIINAYMFTSVIIAFIVFMSIAKKRPIYLIGIPLIIMTGIAVSAAYFLPFIYEMHFINYKSVIINSPPISNLFILPRQTGKLRPDFFWATEDYYIEFVAYVSAFLIITVLVILKMRRFEQIKSIDSAGAMNKFLAGMSFFSIFLLFGPSMFIWNTIPFFKYINTPARWLNITAFAVIFLSASGFFLLEVSPISRIKRYFLLAIIFLLCLLPDYKYMSSACTFDDRELIPAKDVNWLPEHLPAGVNAAGIDKDLNFKERRVTFEGNGKVEIVEWKSAERIIRITAEQPIALRVGTFNFPGWTAFLDDGVTKIRTEDGSGAILVDVTEGVHTLKLNFLDTPLRYYSKIISLVSIFVIIFLSLFSKKRLFNKL